MAESFGAVDISNMGSGSGKGAKEVKKRGRKCTRGTVSNRDSVTDKKKLEIEIGKRQLVDVMVTEGAVEGCGRGEKKRKEQKVDMTTINQRPKVVL